MEGSCEFDVVLDGSPAHLVLYGVKAGKSESIDTFSYRLLSHALWCHIGCCNALAIPL